MFNIIIGIGVRGNEYQFRSHSAQFGAIRLTCSHSAHIRAHILRQFHHENASTLQFGTIRYNSAQIRECAGSLHFRGGIGCRIAHELHRISHELHSNYTFTILFNPRCQQ